MRQQMLLNPSGRTAPVVVVQQQGTTAPLVYFPLLLSILPLVQFLSSQGFFYVNNARLDFDTLKVTLAHGRYMFEFRSMFNQVMNELDVLHRPSAIIGRLGGGHIIHCPKYIDPSLWSIQTLSD